MQSSIGEILLDAGRLQPSQLESAHNILSEGNGCLADILVRLGFVSEQDLSEALAASLKMPIATQNEYQHPLPANGISHSFLLRHLALPTDDTRKGMRVIMADPTDTWLKQAVELATDRPVIPALGTVSAIRNALQYLGQNNTAPASSDTIDNIEQLKELASEAPVVQAVNQLLAYALEINASDIHLEAAEKGFRLRYRIDGMLQDHPLPKEVPATAMVSRIKVMSGLNIAEHRLPQDGRIKVPVNGKPLDMRVATLPGLHGEGVVIRLLNRQGIQLDFATLGFDTDSRQKIDSLLAQSQGVILVTGPTGSGKTTTLYAALQKLNIAERKIITVEDPVEYQLEGINQIQVHPAIQLDFANVLRSMLRQDPDVIMVGEMRDRETARIAVQAALTGHQVLSTLHTNDAAGSFARLRDMGIEPFLITATLRGVVAQRLVRCLCEACRQPASAKTVRQALSKIEQAVSDAKPKLYEAVGCPHCKYTGYRGRTTIAEVLCMSDTLRELIHNRASTADITREARHEGMCSLYENGLRKALSGITSVQEVKRVCLAQEEIN